VKKIKQRIILFYDNLTRDYRGLLLLAEILHAMGHKTWIHPLWDDAIGFIREISPDTVVMGQIGEYSTSAIGYFVQENHINLVLNSTEMAIRPGYMERFFRCNFKEYNDEIVDLQVVMSRDLDEFLKNNPKIKDKRKFKFIGCPRMDLSVDKNLIGEEISLIKKTFHTGRYEKVFLYISSFQFDESGGQIDEEDQNYMEGELLKQEEQRQKKQHKEILEQFYNTTIADGNLLLIKKHPWDKSQYYHEHYNKKNCIVLDNFWYVAPLIAVSDVILHTRSTVAIEGWIQNKMTISILPDFNGDRDTQFSHMRYEPIVTHHDELRSVIDNYPTESIEKSLRNYQPMVDGKSTIRLAKEIDGLAVKPSKTRFVRSGIELFKKRIKRAERMLFYNRHLNRLPDDDYAYHLLSMEQYKKKIDALYRKRIRGYVDKNIREII